MRRAAPSRRLFLAATLAAPGLARAQGAYPNRPVVLVAPFSAGGASDIAARTLATHAPRFLGQPIVVENRTGASGAIGTQHVARARADGYTMLAARIASSAVLPALDPRAPYAWDEFTMLGLLDENPYVVCVRADAPWRSLADLLAAIRAEPGKLNFSTSGPTTILDLGIRHLLGAAGLPLDAAAALPFRGGGEALTALLGGQAQFLGNNLADMAGALQGGTVRALAISTRERFSTVPDVPTAREAGFPALEQIVGWNALFGPPGLPPEVTETWLRVLGALALDQEGWLGATRRLGSVPRITGPDETRRFVQQQVALYTELGRRLGLRPG